MACPPKETSPDENGSQRYHSIILVLMFFCRTNADFDARRFPKIANLNDPETQTRRIKIATGSISFETDYISSGMNSIYFEITCNSIIFFFDTGLGTLPILFDIAN